MTPARSSEPLPVGEADAGQPVEAKLAGLLARIASAQGGNLSLSVRESEEWLPDRSGRGYRRAVERSLTYSLAPPSGRARRLRIWLSAGIAVAVAVLAALWTMMRNEEPRPPARAASVSVALQPASEAVATVGIANGGDKRKAALTARPSKPTDQAAVSAAIALGPAGVVLEEALSREQALARALSSGEAQPWADGSHHGWIVVGEASGGDRNCRDVSILTRSEGQPDDTVHSRECRLKR